DLKNPTVERSISEIETIALRSGRDRAVQVRRHRAGRARLMAGQPEVADLHRLCGIAQIVHLEHAVAAPARDAGNQEADAGVALPPALVCVLVVAADTGHEPGVGGIGDVPDFMRQTAERTQQIDRVRVSPGQAPAVAYARHLRTAGLGAAFGPGDMREI